MFDNLTNKLISVFKNLKGHGTLRESDISDGMRQVRLALLEADVNYKVAKQFVDEVSKRALGVEVIKSLSPGQQVVKIVNEEMIRIMGGERQNLHLTKNKLFSKIPSIMLVGLQGSGKTTTAGKLAYFLKKKSKKPFLISLDTYRPAAMEQLKVIADQLEVLIYDSSPKMSQVDIYRSGLFMASKSGCDIIILDTAGRLGIDIELMGELVELEKIIKPSDMLLVADSMSGQDAVNVAKKFDEVININGIILTKMDSDARGGAALSMKFTTGKHIKFIGVGEKLHDFEPFYPDRIASRILGMGDMQTILDKAQMVLDRDKTIEIEKKIKKNLFSLEDFKEQMKQVKKMGPLKDILGMLPGIGKLKQFNNMEVNEDELVRIEAMINSMTLEERENYSIINGSRRKRIAKGSGTRVQDVNRLIKNYIRVMKMMQKFSKGSISGFNPDIF